MHLQAPQLSKALSAVHFQKIALLSKKVPVFVVACFLLLFGSNGE